MEKLNETIVSLINKIDEFGGHAVPIKINTEADLAVLKKLLEELLKNNADKNIKTLKSISETYKNQTKLQSNLSKEIGIKLDKFVSEESSISKNIEKNLKSIQKEIKNSKKTKETEDEKLNKRLTAVMKVVEIVSKKSQEIVDNLSERYTERILLNQRLQESGIRLAKGFDEQYYKLAASAGRTQDLFADLLKSNASFVNQMNAAGSDGAKTISKMAKSTIGKWATTTKESDAILQHIGENMTEFDSIQTMKSKNFYSEMETTTKLFKQLSMATGKSVDQILKDVEARRKDFVHRRLSTDEKTKDKYRILAGAGFSNELIESILLGTPNKESVMASIGSGSMISELTSLFRRNDLSPEQLMEEASKIANSHSGDIERYRKNAPLGALAMGGRGTPFEQQYSALDAFGRLGKGGFDISSMKKIGDNTDVETAGTNSYIKMQASMDSLEATIREIMTPSIGTSTVAIDTASATIRKLTTAIDTVVPSALGTMVGTAKDVLGPLVNLGIGTVGLVGGGKLIKKGLKLGKNKNIGSKIKTATKKVGSKATTVAKNVGSKAATVAKNVGPIAGPLAVGAVSLISVDNSLKSVQRTSLNKLDAIKKRTENGELTSDDINWLTSRHLETLFTKPIDLSTEEGKKQLEEIIMMNEKAKMKRMQNNTSISESVKMPTSKINEPDRQLQESIEDASSKIMNKETIPDYKHDLSRVISLLNDISNNTKKTFVHNLT